jgi:hypothetical protein
MAHPIHSLDRTSAHALFAPQLPRVPAKTVINTPAPTAPASVPTQSASAPSFSAVFAQIAAAAAAVGTTVASIAPTSGASGANSAATAPAPAAPADAANDPAGPLFGPDPWLADPTGEGPGGVVTHYSPVYFATQQTAQTVAQLLGGTVTQSVQITTAPGSPFTQDQPNYMVQLPNGGQVNPGLIADLYTHGWNQALVNQQIANEVAGAQPALNS